MLAERKLKPPSPCNCTNIRRASRALTMFYDALLEPAGLKVTQYSLLNNVRRLGPLTMKEFSQAMRLERTTLVRNLKILEKMELVRIETEGNSQARLLSITASGQDILEKATPYWTQAQKSVDELFTIEELNTFKKALQKIESMIP